MRYTDLDRNSNTAPCGEEPCANVFVLAVGDMEEWLRQRQPFPPGGRVILASFQDASKGLLNRLKPQMVVSPLLSREFDCIDLAQVLFKHRFKGQYRVISGEIPNPRIVVAEIKAQCPGLDFAILQAPPPKTTLTS